MHLLLIEDDRALAQLVAEYLQQNGYQVTCAYNGRAGLQQALEHEFELLLLDIMLPEMDGFEVLRELRKRQKTPVLMLTAKGEDTDKIIGLELGADDYLAKPFNHRELLARVRAILRRSDMVQQQHQASDNHVGDLHICTAQREIRCQQQPLTLTGLEYEIILLLSKTPGQTVAKQQLSEQCLGRKLTPFDRSVDTHVSNIRKKLQQVGSHCQIQSQRGKGYSLIC